MAQNLTLLDSKVRMGKEKMPLDHKSFVVTEKNDMIYTRLIHQYRHQLQIVC